MYSHRVSILSLLLASLFAAQAALATTYVMISDGDLADQAPAIAQVRVVAVEAAPVAGRPATDYTVEVERLLKGFLPGTTLIVRVPGGVSPDGLGFKVWGAPEFDPGDRALLFLAPRDDGTFGILHLMLGAFVGVRVEGRELAVRNLAEAREVRIPGGLTDEEAERAGWPRDLGRFADWLADRSAGIVREGDYFVEPSASTLNQMEDKFTLFERDGVNLRWFEFDRGNSVPWRAHESGQEGVPGGGFTEFQQGIAAWNNDPDTNINYRFAGTTTATGGLQNFDFTNTILFNDPNNEIEGEFACPGGGTLAIGGPWFDPGRQGQFNGRTFIEILGGDIVTNNGIRCFFEANVAPGVVAAEIFAHELGHTLALGHSCGDAKSPSCADPILDDALMRAFVHNDGRGARLSTDDRLGIRFLYGSGSGGVINLPAPSNLVAELDGLTAILTWQDNSSNEEGFRIYRGVGGGTLELHATVPADTTVFVDSNLAANTRHDYQVAAFNAQGESKRSNTATVTTPVVQPVSVVVTLVTQNPAVGSGTELRATFSGPVVEVRWKLGERGFALTNKLCDANAFCLSHLFSEAGTHTVTVTVVGDLGQTAQDEIGVTVNSGATDAVATSSFIQSVIFGPRGGEAIFKSNLWLMNRGDRQTLVELIFVPRGAADADPKRREVTLQPGTALFVPNVLETVFQETVAQGSLVITSKVFSPPGAANSGPPDVRTFSRSFVDLVNPADGSFGQHVGEEPDSTWSSAEKVVTGILEGNGFIATLLAANLDDQGGLVHISLRDANGEVVGSPASFGLGPRSMRFRPVTDLFPEAVNRPAPFTAHFTSDGIRFSASSTLLEVNSEDQIFVPAKPLTSADLFFIPRFLRNRGQFDVLLSSRLAALNTSSEPTTLTLEFWLRGQDNTNPPTVTRVIPGGAMLFFEDAVLELFGMEEATGALRVRWENSEGKSPRILSYVLTQTPVSNGGGGLRFGTLVDSRTLADAVSTAGVDFGAEQSDLFRASYGAMNLNPGRTVVEVTLKEDNGTVVETAVLPLKPQQHLERNVAGIFSQLGSGKNLIVETQVLEGGPVLTYLANINASGDIFFVPGRPANGPLGQ